MALSFALLLNTFTSLASADEIEMVGETAPAYADYVADELTDNIIYDADELNRLTRQNGNAATMSWKSGEYFRWTEKVGGKSSTYGAGCTVLQSKHGDLTENLVKGEKYVFSARLRNALPEVRPAIDFAMSLYYGIKTKVVTVTLTSSEFQTYTSTFEADVDADSINLGLDAQVDRSAYTTFGAVDLDISNGGSLYIAKEALHDINVAVTSATKVEQRGTVSLSAELVNQVDMPYGTQDFKWYVVNTDRTEKISEGFTFSEHAADTTLTVAKDVTPGKYVVMAESTTDSKFKKGVEIEVTKEVLKDNGGVTLVKADDGKSSYDVFGEFTVTAGNLTASDIDWFAVKDNKMDKEDKIIITPTEGTSAKVTFVDGIGDGTYYIVAQSKADDSKRKLLEITVDNSNVRETIIKDFNSRSTTSWEANFDRYVILIGEDTDAYQKADKTEILKLIVEQSKLEAFTDENLSKLFKSIVALSLYNKNPNSVELNKADGTFNFESDLDLASIDSNDVTIYSLYKTAMTLEGQKKVIAALTGKDIKTVSEFKEIFAINTILNAVSYPKVLGFQYVRDVLTAENMDYAKIDIGNYLSPKDGDNSGYNKEIARKTLTKSQLETILASDIAGVPEEEIYQPAGSEKTEIEIPIGTAGADSTSKTFSDVPDSHWAYQDIYFLTELGVISGVSEELFAPEGVITREAAAKMICIAFDLKATGEAKNFSDVDPDAWYAEYIKIASSAGVVNGISDDKFGVGMPVTRQDLCVMIARALNAELSDVEVIEFEDNDAIAEYAKKSVSYLYVLSIISGYNDNTFRPQGLCKRSEIARIISRTLNIVDQSAGDADDELVYSKAEELFFGMGAVDVDKYKSNANVTRAGLAEFINDTCVRAVHDVDSEWENNVSTDEMVNSVPKLFSDLDESHLNYYDIEAVVNKGYMEGISETLFAPDIQVNLGYVVKTLLNIMGYGEIAAISGGNQSDYIELARSLDLLDDVNSEMDAPARYKDVVRLFANAMEIGVNKIGSIRGSNVVLSSESNKTFMTEVMDINVVEGVMTDNGVTGLSGGSKVEKNTVIVGGHKIIVPEDIKGHRDLIGRYVRAYYDCSDDTEKVLVYMVESRDDDTYQFALSDFVSFDGKTLVYEEKGRDKTLSIGAATVIYNGTIIDSYDETLFKDKNGDVAVLSVYKKNDYIIVNEYKDFVASKVSAESEKIYGNATYVKDSELTILNLKKGDEFEEVNICFSTGEAATFADIQADSVLAVKLNKTSGIIDIYIHKEVLYNTKVTSVGEESIKVAITGEDGEAVTDGEYEVSESFKSSDVKLEAGRSYNLYFNMFGEIVYAEIVEITDGRQMGILTKAISDEDEETYGAKIYDENEAIVLYTFAERVNVNDKRTKREEVKAVIDAYCGEPILFTVTDGVITDIITPESPNGSDKNRGFYKIIEPIDKDGNPVLADTSSLDPSKVSTYKADNWYLFRNAGDGASFGGRFSYDRNKTKVYVVPANSDDYSNPEKFSINVKTFADHTWHMVDAYAYTQDAVVPDVIIAREEAKRGGSVEPDSIFLITGFKQGLSDDDQIRNIIEGYKITNKDVTFTELPVSEEVVFLAQQKNTAIEIGGTSRIYYDSNTNHYATVDNLVGNVGPRVFEELSAGDIVRYALDSDNEISTIAVSFDYEIDDEGHNNDGLSQSFEPENVASGTTYGYVMKSDTDGIKILEKYTKKVDGSNVTLVTGSKPEHTNLSSYDAYSRMYGFLSGAGYKVLFIEKKGSKNLTGWVGSVDDVISYEDSASDYDEMVMLTRYKGGQIAAIVYR